jgi:hypothetical protein
MSFEGFIKYLEKHKFTVTKFEEALKTMKKIAYYLIASVSPKIKRYQYTFEVVLSVRSAFRIGLHAGLELNPLSNRGKLESMS